MLVDGKYHRLTHTTSPSPTQQERFSKSRSRAYYFNRNTGESLWEKPPGFVGGAASGGGATAEKVRASHLLVKHRESRNPKSWKEDNITRTKEEALQKINDFRTQLISGTDFAQLASKESDCSSAKRGGDLGVFGRGDMQAAFENATYALQVGELSQPVFSDSGVHLILRTA
ncbi:peptidyl-prolyl cis/trans isomerase NIMA-interacting 1-like protein [Fimicolochytrium jonesii]|uniref:peptidyl-prolyl cis/trans isomerase NIMA-interacting 1-like protein n=1 Tax=Fimicolochytrium jonesii TaxID=1396493 RepID=UPI0022FE4D0B|nr:peptidyl-prolyl cis/trans isomerase NIMA-interacting 1-like protein [Fimicolochytrium jonesii]KAI8821777.1 peptidyl-prolyl cis/trans isomerase NIMA-interacting 1-like protein [Fimicolochytrium jonesii]